MPTTNRGLSAGRMPANVIQYFESLYRPFSTCCAVPVLPEIWYPVSAAAGPVPELPPGAFWVTARSMFRTVVAVSLLTTRTPSGRGSSTRDPSGLTFARRIRGGTRTPSLASAWYMPAICSTVIDNPCPIGRLPNVLPDHCPRGGTRPGLSPGSPTPVRWPKPSLVNMSAYRSGPTFCASISVPTLDDLANTPVVVSGSTPCSHASCTVRSATLIVYGTWRCASGVVTPYSIADSAVTILFTEPGSYGSDTAGLPISLMSKPSRLVGSKPLSLASAYTSPVCASMITALPPLAPTCPT